MPADQSNALMVLNLGSSNVQVAQRHDSKFSYQELAAAFIEQKFCLNSFESRESAQLFGNRFRHFHPTHSKYSPRSDSNSYAQHDAIPDLSLRADQPHSSNFFNVGNCNHDSSVDSSSDCDSDESDVIYELLGGKRFKFQQADCFRNDSLKMRSMSISASPSSSVSSMTSSFTPPAFEFD